MDVKKLSKHDMAKEAARMMGTLSPRRTATVLGLYGDLGAGKTTFAQALARVFGIKETVTSPTFVIMKTYALPKRKTHFKHLIHIDAYRLRGSSELTKLGWETLLNDPANLIVIEWAEKVESILPKNTKKICLDVVDEKTRALSYKS
ncbi:tRNA (adenosine(37)-N6)-threonylcarbamoyltransferase complex ATPase subunit type 1 TsaE [Candidatus Kaiserbacteria bacterium]|nr:tRNA (adenosine(37)-N6)-threonylcarbamoyltransferase complex ATPase subunit type 1 TsaE [Candidatus Kaiserbacteria bacterium]